MNNKTLLTLLAPLAATALFGQKNEASKSQPNVVLIYADDLGYGDLSCYGAQRIKTPNVDKLARGGVQFMNGYATAATSTPSRYSMLTGEYAWRKPGTGVAAGDAGMIIRPEQFTLADVFKSAEYRTAAIGKWHLGLGDTTGSQDWNAPLAAHLGDLGFDYSYIMAATADRVPCVFIENGKVANYDAEHPIEVSYKKPFEGEPLGRNNPELLYNLKHSHGHDMAIVNGIGRIGYMKGGGNALWKDEDIADSITYRATEFIRDSKEQPFFLYFATNDIHVPRFPHSRFRGQSSMGLRGDAILQFDWCVGEIVRVLKEMGVYENTIIVLSSDNGGVLDDGYDDQAEALAKDHQPAGPHRGMKYSGFDGGTAVPFIVSWPKHAAKNMKSEALVSQIDFVASFASLLNVRLPKASAPDSQNHISTWLGENQDSRPWIVQQGSMLTLRTPEWKYIEPNPGPARITWGPNVETANSSTPQLYRVDKDIAEQTNVALEHPAIVFEMQGLLKEIKAK